MLPQTKKTFLTLAEKMKVIELHNRGQSLAVIAEKLHVGKTQIHSAIQSKQLLLQQWQQGAAAGSKVMKTRISAYQSINEATYSWFLTARQRNLPITGALLKQKAKEIAQSHGMDYFCASNGWLFKFQKRHNISSRSLSGESAEVPTDAVADWVVRIPHLCEGYAPENTFNADETGLYFRAPPTRSLVQKGETCHGTKRSKERITVLFCCSATGEKIPPLIIGKYRKPRCFTATDTAGIGVHYDANKRAWMTREIFLKWLNTLNNRMIRNGRNILLFLDNCPAHPPAELSNMKIVFLPPNTTSLLQPLDAGIIKRVKMDYRSRLLSHLARVCDSEECTPSCFNKVSYLWFTVLSRLTRLQY